MEMRDFVCPSQAWNTEYTRICMVPDVVTYELYKLVF
jgi:hypothetical protein